MTEPKESGVKYQSSKVHDRDPREYLKQIQES